MNRTLIIAEAGVNHNGDIILAKRLIDVAVAAKVDIVKFQTAIPELVVSVKAEKAEYQKKETGEGSQLEMIRKIHFPLEVYKELQQYCNDNGIHFLSTPFDHVSINFLKSLGMKIFKIPSGEITNKPYLRAVGKVAEEVILSTGMSTLEEIGEAIEVLYSVGVKKDDLTVLHCNTDYPTAMEDVNLTAMNDIKDKFDVRVGYSDHTLGIEVPIAAVSLGATVIEKHFTLDRTMEGPDQKASLEPNELTQMVTSIRNVEVALGNGKKAPTLSELKNREIARKSIHMLKDINAGEALTEENLTTRRPGNGINPMEWDEIIGRKVLNDLEEGDILTLNDLKEID
jgi:N,N'-diacetyllegionaminate synthase